MSTTEFKCVLKWVFVCGLYAIYFNDSLVACVNIWLCNTFVKIDLMYAFSLRSTNWYILQKWRLWIWMVICMTYRTNIFMFQCRILWPETSRDGSTFCLTIDPLTWSGHGAIKHWMFWQTVFEYIYIYGWSN